MKDLEVLRIIKNEETRQEDNIELIASENYVSNDVLEAVGSILTNKYAEGYPGRRYYGGCEFVDDIEQLAKDRAKALFNVKYVNVQPHSGSQANMAAYRALLNKGDKVLAMALEHGGHLTHGHKLSFSGQDYEFRYYQVSKDTQMIDYDEIERITLEFRPKLIVAGASAYAREIDFRRFRQIADSVSAYLMVDMAHIAGLVAAGIHQNPVDYADIVTSTTHKTLRGPRGGLILTNNYEVYKNVNSALFPGIQGGPLMHVIAGKAVCFGEALKDSFKEYAKCIVSNAKALANALIEKGYKVVTGGTDNHLLLVDMYASCGLTGKEVEVLLDRVGITVNKNTVPFDSLPPMVASGIRMGTAAITTRGFKEADMKEIATLIDEAIKNKDDEAKLAKIHEKVLNLTKKYPLEKVMDR
ncbi:MAG: serine hydroxymethyltransferase [Bacilli bacterium]|nr:serine hydroxymethyltransferase [Bacilli bacterium]MBP5551453.1 serine hydroxymethyltransferase [Bacilli bacterium]